MKKQEHGGKPPHSNTGVKNTTMKNREKLSVCIDWLAFTFDYSFTLDNVVTHILRLPLDSFERQERAGNGYTVRYFSELFGVNVLFHPEKKEMGIHVEMSGNALRTYIDTKGNEGLQSLLENIQAGKGHLTRLDIALDDKSGSYYTLDSLKEELEQGNIVSRWEDFEIRFRGKIANPGVYTEKTIYFGNMSSDANMRVYDKKLEQMKKNKNPEERKELEKIESWVRWEIVLRHKYADAFLYELMKNDFSFSEIFSRILNYRFRIIDPADPDKNRSRKASAALWISFMGTIDKLRLVFQRPLSNVFRAIEWIRSQVMPTLTGIVLADPYAREIFWQDHQICKKTGRFRKFTPPPLFWDVGAEVLTPYA